jgi:type I restriction enzyme S subunit
LEAAKAISSAILNEMFSHDIFENFEAVRLEDWPCDIASGQAVSSVGGTYKKQGIRYIQGNNITNKGFVLEPAVYIGAETHSAMPRSVVKPRDVLINIVGPPIGKICWYPEDQPEGNTNQAVVRVHCPADLDYRFLTYLLRTKRYYDYFFEVKVGVRQWNISRTNCADIKIPRVPLPSQHDLVRKFEKKVAGNPLVAAVERQVEAIEALPGAILQETFNFNDE